MTAAVAIEGVTVSYYQHVALRDVWLTIPAGEFVGVVGPNGAGKTTLLTVVNGLGRLHSGVVRLFGERLTAGNIRHWRSQVGYVPQELRVDPRVPFSCFDAVLIGVYGRLGLFRSPGAAEIARAKELMRFFRIEPLAARPVGQISGGEMQKVALARALISEPKILLLDEPTVNLDPPSVRELIELISRVYLEFGLTVVMVTHQIEHLPAVCSRVVLMRRARVVFSGDREEGLRTERLEALFAGD